ncbi:hypothetical protein SK578_0528 [Streptococcus mitis]|uniref:Uncharacterized protein n=1 Tax=Streptococcus mitis TaxID=28037 RepID=A0A081QRW0_STRMT|nr:hypothetical protein SK578_0528 [Streptococcus mitis]
MPKVYEIENFSLKIILLIKNSGLIVPLKHQKTHPHGQAGIKNDFISNIQFNQHIPHFH